MDSQVFIKSNGHTKTPDRTSHQEFYLDPGTTTKSVEPQRTQNNKRPVRELTWCAFQAVKLNTKGIVELRSFPFWAFDLAHARAELLLATQKDGCPYTHIWGFGNLLQKPGKRSKWTTKIAEWSILTGEKTK